MIVMVYDVDFQALNSAAIPCCLLCCCTGRSACVPLAPRSDAAAPRSLALACTHAQLTRHECARHTAIYMPALPACHSVLTPIFSNHSSQSQTALVLALIACKRARARSDSLQARAVCHGTRSSRSCQVNPRHAAAGATRRAA